MRSFERRECLYVHPCMPRDHSITTHINHTAAGVIDVAAHAAGERDPCRVGGVQEAQHIAVTSCNISCDSCAPPAGCIASERRCILPPRRPPLSPCQHEQQGPGIASTSGSCSASVRCWPPRHTRLPGFARIPASGRAPCRSALERLKAVIHVHQHQYQHLPCTSCMPVHITVAAAEAAASTPARHTRTQFFLAVGMPRPAPLPTARSKQHHTDETEGLRSPWCDIALVSVANSPSLATWGSHGAPRRRCLGY